MHRFLFILLCALLLPLHAGVVPRGTDLSRLNKGDPEKTYRKREFSAYLPMDEFCKRYKISGYTPFENPTGISYSRGERARLTLHNKPAGSVQFIVRNSLGDDITDYYPLKEGDNEILIKNDGLGYVDYRSPEGCKAPRITVSLSGGRINGIFSQHDSNGTWRRLLAQASGVLDIMGERCQILFPVRSLREAAADEGTELVDIYDHIVGLQQQLMGWEVDDVHPGNHISCRGVRTGYMRADGIGAAFNFKTIVGISNPEGLRSGLWGVAHELGHVNQVRPGFEWLGTSEITNNLYSQLCNYKLCPENLRLEHEGGSTAEGYGVRGACFDAFVNNAIVHHQLWQFQGGPDAEDGAVPSKEPGDVFVALCPLWQLYLYFHEALGREDFYPGIFRIIRNTENPATSGQARVDFCRYVSQVARLDMSDFLLRTGMLAPINRPMDDYGKGRISISLDMVKEVIREAIKYPEPETPVIYYITANTVDVYRKRLDVEPSYDCRPLLPEEDEETKRKRLAGREKGKCSDFVIPGEKWKNAVAYEVYEEDKLVRVCLRGLGQQDNDSTTVICPPGATCIKAVQWDGKRYVVTELTVEKKEKPWLKREKKEKGQEKWLVPKVP